MYYIDINSSFHKSISDFYSLGLFAVIIFKLAPMTIKIIDYIQILKFMMPF